MQLPRGKYTDQIDNFWLYTVSLKSAGNAFPQRWRRAKILTRLVPFQMLAAIGETFETPYVAPSSTSAPPPDAAANSSPASFSNEITGVIVSSRKAFYRINIWTRTSAPGDKERIENIGRHFKYGVLGLDGNFKISERDKVSSDVEFVSHKDSQAKASGLQGWSRLDPVRY